MLESANAWIIESYAEGSKSWSLSRHNETTTTHSLEWCFEKWREVKDSPDMLTTHLEHYRLRNIRTNDIIMCGVL